jgi:hypothetical protein
MVSVLVYEWCDKRTVNFPGTCSILFISSEVWVLCTRIIVRILSEKNHYVSSWSGSKVTGYWLKRSGIRSRHTRGFIVTTMSERMWAKAYTSRMGTRGVSRPHTPHSYSCGTEIQNAGTHATMFSRRLSVPVLRYRDVLMLCNYMLCFWKMVTIQGHYAEVEMAGEEGVVTCTLLFAYRDWWTLHSDLIRAGLATGRFSTERTQKAHAPHVIFRTLKLSVARLLLETCMIRVTGCPAWTWDF